MVVAVVCATPYGVAYTREPTSNMVATRAPAVLAGAPAIWMYSSGCSVTLVLRYTCLAT